MCATTKSHLNNLTSHNFQEIRMPKSILSYHGKQSTSQIWQPTLSHLNIQAKCTTVRFDCHGPMRHIHLSHVMVIIIIIVVVIIIIIVVVGPLAVELARKNISDGHSCEHFGISGFVTILGRKL
jgi:hypothetical protein